ncbi:MAG: flippase-like domain-containing protein [Candidatus Obscuribacterales bacterium]|nr:flippase-like domain-containing protein [Candidatus Obscuribacterales bacterium]
MRRLPKFVQICLRLAVSLLLFAALFILGKIDLTECLKIAAKANPQYLTITISLVVVTIIISALRWQRLAVAVGLHQPLWRFVQYTFVGAFFTLFLPATLGSDVSRAVSLSKNTGQPGVATYSVLADRVIGLFVLLMLGAVSLSFCPDQKLVPFFLKITIVVGTLAMLPILNFLPQLSMRLLGEGNWLTKQLHGPCAEVYWNDRGVVVVALLLSLLMHTVFVLSHAVLAQSLGITNVPLWYFFFMHSSVVMFALIVPNISGIGVREFGYTYFLTQAGVNQALAASYAIMWLGLTLGNSLLGGAVYLLGHFQIEKEQEESTA